MSIAKSLTKELTEEEKEILYLSVALGRSPTSDELSEILREARSDVPAGDLGRIHEELFRKGLSLTRSSVLVASEKGVEVYLQMAELSPLLLGMLEEKYSGLLRKYAAKPYAEGNVLADVSEPDSGFVPVQEKPVQEKRKPKPRARVKPEPYLRETRRMHRYLGGNGSKIVGNFVKMVPETDRGSVIALMSDVIRRYHRKVGTIPSEFYSGLERTGPGNPSDVRRFLIRTRYNLIRDYGK